MLRRIALINCAMALSALLIRNLLRNEAVSAACDWVLLIAWLVQGVYLFCGRKKK